MAGLWAASEERPGRKDLTAATGLALILFILYYLPAPFRPLQETAEVRVAVVAREMIQRGDWVVPRLGEEIRLAKPPLPYWMMALSAEVLGPDASGRAVSEMAALLPCAAAASLCVFLVVLFGAQVFGRTAGMWSGVILGLSIHFLRFAQIGSGEMLLTLFTTAALLATAWLVCSPAAGIGTALLLGASLGLAVLTKWHVPLLIVLGAAAIAALRTRPFPLRKVALFGLAIGLAAALASLWAFQVWQQVPGAWEVMRQEMVDGIHATGHLQNNRWSYYFEELTWRFLPWTPLLLALGAAWYSRRQRDRDEGPAADELLPNAIARFLAWGTAAAFLGFYVCNKQQHYYLLPLIPSLALLAGYGLSRLDRAGGLWEEHIAWILLGTGALGGAGIAIAPYWIATLTPYLTLPAGVWVVMLAVWGSRKWSEGRGCAAAWCLVAALSLPWAGWSLLSAAKARENNTLYRSAERLQYQLQAYPEARIYAARVSEPEERMLYYLNLKQIGSLSQLQGLNPAGAPDPAEAAPIILVCDATLARELGYEAASEDLQLVPLPQDRRRREWTVLRGLGSGKTPKSLRPSGR